MRFANERENKKFLREPEMDGRVQCKKRRFTKRHSVLSTTHTHTQQNKTGWHAQAKVLLAAADERNKYKLQHSAASARLWIHIARVIYNSAPKFSHTECDKIKSVARVGVNHAPESHFMGLKFGAVGVCSWEIHMRSRQMLPGELWNNISLLLNKKYHDLQRSCETKKIGLNQKCWSNNFFHFTNWIF